jgi:protein phosphatase
LGDYVDRGTKSVETILLLFALKLKYPENFILLRGSHEDRSINRSMGFGDECATKFKENIDDPVSFFQKCNRLFDKLPLAALIDDSILCVHGGIGITLKSINEIAGIERPLKVNHDPKSRQEKIIYELLWSDPYRGN